jgi:membrane-bound metal-dependent hydrolase YbcI (DUF457 family)
MTPLGHLSVSYVSGSIIESRLQRHIALPAVIIGGILPDVDFIFIFFDWFNTVHRVISHNLLFISAIAFTGSLLCLKENKKAVAIGLFTGGILHLAIDSFLDNNPTNGIGIAFLWPFFDNLLSPFNLLNENEAGIGWDQPLKMIRLMIPLILYEAPLYVIAAFLFVNQGLHRQKSCGSNA